MHRAILRPLTLLLLIVLTAAVYSQTRQSLDWDLSYNSLLEKNKVRSNVAIRKWLAGIRSPAEKWITGWKGKPITSSILIEYPAFHAAERQTIWLVRTADDANYWELTEDFQATEWADEAELEEPFAPQIYDEVFKAAWAWKQFAPKSAAQLPDQAFPGYMGFLSLYGPDGSKQMLLTLDDFMLCRQKGCQPGNLTPGRLMSALQPILIPETERNYKHRSEAEIAAMTPEQRIDEQIMEDEVHPMWATSDDKQSQMISRYRRNDGLKGSSHLVRLIANFHPKRQRSDRSHAAMMMANYIDERVVRLRASKDGRDIIQAIERMAARMKDHNGPDSQAGLTLRSLTGTNQADDSVRDTLWVRHRIKLTDEEFLAFVNYLIETDPTYPSWSERNLEKIKGSEAREVNDLGVPVTQVFVMKDSERFHKAYLAFTKARAKD